MEPKGDFGSQVTIGKTITNNSPPLPKQNGSRLASEVLFSSSGRMVGRGLNFVSQLLIARTLGLEIFGIFAIGWNILRLLVIIGPLGLEQAVILYGSKYWKQSASKLRGLFLGSALFSLGIGILLGVLLFLFSTQIAVSVFRKPDLEIVFRWLGLILPLSILLHVLASATTVSQTTRFAVLLEEFAQPFLQITVWLALLIFGNDSLEGALQSVFLSYLIPTALVVLAVIRIFPEVVHTKSSYSFLNRDLFAFTIPASFAILFGSLISWGDRLIVGYFRSAGEAGIYQAISLVSIVFATLLSGIKAVVSPVVARLYSQSDLNRVKEIYTISTRWGLYTGLFLFISIFVSGRELLSLGFGEEYAAGYVPLVILAFSQVINLGTGPLDVVLIMIGRQREWLAITIKALLVNLVLGILLTIRFGIIGTSISTSITVMVTFILGFIQLRKAIPVHPYNVRSFLAIAGAVFASGSFLIFRSLFPHLNDWLFVILSSIIILASFGLWIGKFIVTQEEKGKMIEVITSFRKPTLFNLQQKMVSGEYTDD